MIRYKAKDVFDGIINYKTNFIKDDALIFYDSVGPLSGCAWIVPKITIFIIYIINANSSQLLTLAKYIIDNILKNVKIHR